MDLRTLVARLIDALDDEIRAVFRSQRTFQLTDGLLVDPAHRLWRYSTDRECNLPDGTPGRIQIVGAWLPCTICDSHGLTLLLELTDEVEAVQNTRFRPDVAYLLRQLRSRLTEIAMEHGERILMALGHRPIPAAPLVDVTSQLGDVASRLNAEQRHAVAGAFSFPVTPIVAPPGCGKTLVIGATGRCILAMGETMLVLSPTRRGLDQAIGEILQWTGAAAEEGQIVRFGNLGPDTPPEVRAASVREIARRREPDLVAEFEVLSNRRAELGRSLSAGNLSHRRDEVDELARVAQRLRQVEQHLVRVETDVVRDGRVLGTTLAKASITPLIFSRFFDLVAIDEASMAHVPMVAFAASLGRRICYAGDPRQLGPITMARTARARQFLVPDIFTYKASVHGHSHELSCPGDIVLRRQYRMAPDIRRLVSGVFYGNLLIDGENVAAQTAPIANRPPFPGHTITFFDIGPVVAQSVVEHANGRPGSHFNVVSALIALDLCAQAVQLGTSAVAALTPYAAQARLLQLGVQDLDLEAVVRTGTTHRLQGAQADLVVFDFCDTFNLHHPGQPLRGGLGSPGARNLCVALSRAQGKLWPVGDFQFLQEHSNPSSALRTILDQMPASAVADYPPAEQSNALATGRIAWFRGVAEAHGLLHQDLQRAASRILVAVPRARDLDWINLASLERASAPAVVRAPDGSSAQWNRFRESPVPIQAPSVSECIVIIDDLLWRWPSIDSPPVVVRAHLPRTATLVARLFGFREIPRHELTPVDELGIALGVSPVPAPSVGQPVNVRDPLYSGRRRLNLR